MTVQYGLEERMVSRSAGMSDQPPASQTMFQVELLLYLSILSACWLSISHCVTLRVTRTLVLTGPLEGLRFKAADPPPCASVLRTKTADDTKASNRKYCKSLFVLGTIFCPQDCSRPLHLISFVFSHSERILYQNWLPEPQVRWSCHPQIPLCLLCAEFLSLSKYQRQSQRRDCKKSQHHAWRKLWDSGSSRYHCCVFAGAIVREVEGCMRRVKNRG